MEKYKQISIQSVDDLLGKPGIYMLECKQSKRFYYGQSRNVRKRIKHHLSTLKNNKHDNKFMQHCWNKYEQIEAVSVIYCNLKDLDMIESSFINHNRDNNLMMNITKDFSLNKEIIINTINGELNLKSTNNIINIEDSKIKKVTQEDIRKAEAHLQALRDRQSFYNESEE